MALTKVKINLGTQGNLSGSRSIIQSTKTLVSGSAQIASNISGSFTSTSSSIASDIAGNLSSINTLNGTGTAQGVGTSDSPTFNNITATGTLTAQEIHTEFTSASIVFTSGSTKTGNSTDDIHQMTGSLNISGSLDVNDGNLSITDKMVVGSGSSFNFSNTNHPFTVRSSGNNAGFSVLGSQGTELLRFIQESNDSGKLDIYDGGSLKLRLSGHANETNYINNGGDVGIGIASPTTYYEKVLHIHESAGSSAIHLTNNTTGTTRDDGIDLICYQDDLYLWNREAGDLLLGTNATTRMYISGSGNVGIGTTSPDSLLHVKTTANVSETIRIQNDDSLTTIGVSSDGYSFHTYQHSLYYASWDGSSWSTKARFDNDGKFGLGGTSPVGKLDIAQGGYTAGTQAIHFGADSGDNTSRSNNTTKYGVITGDHYSTSEEKIELITYYSNSSANSLSFGGSGNSAYNAPTEIAFRIASGYTVTSDNANTIFLVNGGGVTVKQGYPIVAGRAATSGGRILAGHYGQANNDYLAVLSTHYSSGGFIVGYGVEGKENANGYVSTQDAFNGVRTAIQQDTDGIKFLVSAATQASPGTDVSMTEIVRFKPSGVIGIESGDASGTGATKGIHIDTNGVPFLRYQETNSSGGTADYEIYVANGVYVLYDVDDSATVYSVSTSQVISGDFNDTSDVGLKENIKTIDSGLSVVNKLNPVTFDWKNKKKGSNSGFIAQEVEKLLPNDVEGEDFNTDYPSGRVGDVTEDEDKGFNNFGKSINLGGIVAHLTKAVQELSEEVEKLKGK